VGDHVGIPGVVLFAFTRPYTGAFVLVLTKPEPVLLLQTFYGERCLWH
jgi:hypothetical protein